MVRVISEIAIKDGNGLDHVTWIEDGAATEAERIVAEALKYDVNAHSRDPYRDERNKYTTGGNMTTEQELTAHKQTVDRAEEPCPEEWNEYDSIRRAFDEAVEAGVMKDPTPMCNAWQRYVEAARTKLQIEGTK